jgi:hypothetical protein
MHFRIESFAREGRLSSDGGIVVVEELEARILVERLDARSHCLAQRAGAIHEDQDLWFLRHLCFLDDSIRRPIPFFLGTIAPSVSSLLFYRNRIMAKLERELAAMGERRGLA